MHKIIIASVLALATAAIAVPQAQAQTYPDVSGSTAFSSDCNYMSKAGYLRYRYFVQSGNWISYEEAKRISDGQG